MHIFQHFEHFFIQETVDHSLPYAFGTIVLSKIFTGGSSLSMSITELDRFRLEAIFLNTENTLLIVIHVYGPA